MKRSQLLHQGLTSGEEGFHAQRQMWPFGDQFAHAWGEGASTDATNLEPEWTQRATDFVLVVADLIDEERAAGQQCPQLLALNDFTCTLLNQPERTSCAIERASLRSVLLCDIAEIAALACRVSMQHTGRPASFRPKYSHCDSGPASRPTRSNEPSKAKSAALIAAGSDDTFASVAIRPLNIDHAYARQLERDIQTSVKL
jgi:hypothetical protein